MWKTFAFYKRCQRDFKIYMEEKNEGKKIMGKKLMQGRGKERREERKERRKQGRNEL